MRNAFGGAVAALALVAAVHAAPPPNPRIDSAAFLATAAAALAHRESHRLTEDQFIAQIGEPGTVVLDARSREKYAALHVRGAVSLPFPDITIESLAALVPDPDTRILIYCNNNFADAPDPFPTKLPSAALNLSTYTALFDHGYRNVYELGPLLAVATTRIPLVAGARPSP
jgi:phage shock protein E